MCASVRIRTDTTLDQDCVVLKATAFVRSSCTVCLKATVFVCTSCTDVSWLTTCMNFNTRIKIKKKKTKFPFCVTLKLKHCLSYWCPHQLDSCLATDITSTNCHHTNVQNVVLGTGSGCPVGQDIQVLLVSKVKNSVVVCRQVDSTSVLSGPKLQ